MWAVASSPSMGRVQRTLSMTSRTAPARMPSTNSGLSPMARASSMSSSYSAPPRKYTRASFHAAEKTSAAQKLNDGDFDGVSLKDIKLLFDVIGKDDSGALDFQEISIFLKEVLVPPCTDSEIEAIYSLTDQNIDGKVTPEEIHKALHSGPVKQHLRQLHTEGKVRKRFDDTQGINAEVTRDLLVERLTWRVTRDDAFRTLPLSTCYMMVFISIVITHLQIWERQQVEAGLEAWMEGYSKELVGPFLKSYVANADSFGSWAMDSGLPAILGECKDNAAGEPFCRVATRNVLLGDVQLLQTRHDGSVWSEWLLQGSEEVRAHLAARPRDFLNASVTRLGHLWSSGWTDEATDELKLAFSTYNRRAKMFALTEVRARFDEYGFVTPAVVASAVIVDPYPSKSTFALDALYCCLLLLPLLTELKDLFCSMRYQGCFEGFYDYINFWNLVDWLSILMGCTGVFVWTLCCKAMQAECLQELLEQDVAKQTLAPTVMKLGPEALTDVKDALSKIIQLFMWLHFVLAINAVTIMLKFFKAFQANPRLQLVTRALNRAANDMFHWSVVFAAIFVGFALSGNILFGGDIIHFNSFGASFNTAFAVLMGDFGWYVDQSESNLGLASGMPFLLLGFWFWIFMVLVTLILLNMLLAIILEHYAILSGELRNQDVPSLFSQTWGYVLQARREKDYIPSSTLVHMLDDEDDPAHPEPRVTNTSLMQEFTMKDEQAEFLMNWLQEEATERQKLAAGGQDVLDARLEAIEGFVEAMSEQLRMASLGVSTCVDTIQEMRAKSKAEAKLQDHKRKVVGARDQPALLQQLAQQSSRQQSAVEELAGLASELRAAALRARPGAPVSKLSDAPPFPQAVWHETGRTPSSQLSKR